MTAPLRDQSDKALTPVKGMAFLENYFSKRRYTAKALLSLRRGGHI